jgi:hypothetical protein
VLKKGDYGKYQDYCLINRLLAIRYNWFTAVQAA